jgi:hypothetical protein
MKRKGNSIFNGKHYYSKEVVLLFEFYDTQT